MIKTGIPDLANYGILGLWTLTLFWEKKHFQKKIIEIVQNNTDALNKLFRRLKK